MMCRFSQMNTVKIPQLLDVGRDKIMDRINNDLAECSSDNLLAVIIGSEGIGKTAFVNKIGEYYRFEDGIICVDFMKCSERHNIKNLKECILSTLDESTFGSYWNLPCKFSMNNLYEHIETQFARGLLILENIDKD